MIHYRIFLVFVLGIAFCLTVNSPSYAANSGELSFGTEFDLFPFINGGYYSSGVISYDHYNARLIIADTKIPDFATPDGYDHWKLKKVTAIILDYFPGENHEGLWFAGGFEHWESEIRNQATEATGTFSQNILTLGTGYVYNFTEHWYINPWIALHYNLSDDTVKINSSDLKLNDLMGEVSVKIGYRF